MRENMYKEKWELGYFYHRISLSSPRGRGRPAPRLLCCSGLSRCSCLLLPRFNPFGLPDWSPLRVSYGKEGQIQDGDISPMRLLTGSVQHRKVELNLIVVKIVLDRGQRSQRGPHLGR